MKFKRFTILVFALLMCFAATPAFARSLFYADNPSSIAVASGATLNTGTALVTGACNVQSITVSQAVTAGDYLLIYDAASATGTPKYDIEMGTSETKHLVFNDAEFGTGVFAVTSGQSTPAFGMHVSIEYTQ
jgi:hypothetical protein